MTIAELVNALDQFDSTHNDDQIVLVHDRDADRHSLAVLHGDGQPRPYEPVVGSTFGFVFSYTGTTPQEEEDE